MRRWGTLILCLGVGLASTGCTKGSGAYNQGVKAEDLQDYDAAFAYYQKAVKANPHNAGYRVKLHQARFEDGEFHVKKGQDLRKKGDLQGAAGEFQRALAIDPGSSIAEQELNKTVEMIAEKNHQNEAAAESPSEAGESSLAATPPRMKPLLTEPINLHMANVDVKLVFDTLGKLAGLTMVYDPDFPARKITVDFTNVTLEQALEVASLESKAFLKPVTENILFVIPDQPQKRRDYEEEVVRTFYLSNTVQPQDITEIVTGLRQLLDLKRIQPLNSQNAIIVRDTPDKLLLAQKIIDDIDKAKPEVLVQVEVLQAHTDRLRDLGISPGQQASVSVTNGTTSSTTTGGTTTTPTNNTLTFNNLRHLNSNDYSVTLPSATANAVLTDTDTRIIQNPEVRSVDGQTAKLKIGSRIPVATGSFQAGVGVGAVGVNPLVNTQFTYLDVGVNLDITPRVHPDHEVSLKLVIDVSSQTGVATIGGITQPIISQRKIEQDIRLKEGESDILGGLFERDDTRTLNGWPGLAKVPFLRYFFSDDKRDIVDDQVLIVLTPRIVRMPEWTKANLRPLFSGTETNVEVKRMSELRAPVPQATPQATTTQQPPATGGAPAVGAQTVAGPPVLPASAPSSTAKLRFEPQTLSLKVGQTATIGVVVENVNDLFSIPMLVQYNPAVISIEEIQHAVGEGGHAGFLSGGNQEIAIVSQPFKEKGQMIISATRQPNTPGVSGTGTIVGIVVKALAPGTSNLSIVEVSAKNSRQQAIPMVTGEATLQVQP